MLQKKRGKGFLISNQLSFSFKSFVGSLVLAVGVESMWDMLGCYFEELLLLSPQELRQYSNLSPIVKACKPGTREGRLKMLRYGVLD